MTNKRKVFIENSDHNYNKMFRNAGWEVVNTPELVDLFCFTGGSDVSPHVYGRDAHPETMNFPDRDTACIEYWEYAQMKDIPCVGICRGGQFLNVMNGGDLWQHVGGHAIGKSHTAYDCLSDKKPVQVSSTHHQMMIPSTEAIILAIADCSTFREYTKPEETMYLDGLPDYEALWYSATNTLCFQPHPEYFPKEHECQKLFFNYLELIV